AFQFFDALQIFQAFLRDHLTTVQSDGLEGFETRQLGKSGVRDRRALKVQRSELWQVREPLQAFVGDFASKEVKLCEHIKPLQASYILVREELASKALNLRLPGK